MIFGIFWWISVIAFFATVLMTFLLYSKKGKGIKPFYAFAIGIFITVLLFVFPIEYHVFQKELLAITKAILVSIFYDVQFFTANIGFEYITENITDITGRLKDGYEIFGSVLMVLCPLLTFGFLISFFKGVTERIKHIFCFTKDTYLFSELNIKSIILAESIFNENKKSIFIFANVSNDNEAVDEDLPRRAKTIGAIIYNKSVSEINLPWNNGNKNLSIFAIEDDENQNIADSVQLIKKYHDRANTNLYLFSTGIESEIMLNNIDKGKMITKRINQKTSFVYNYLWEHGTELFEKCTVKESGEKEISVLILGLGDFGKEILKSLAWYCQMDNYKLRISAFDRQTNIENQILGLCPKLLDSAHNNKQIDGDAYYEINIKTADIDTNEFYNDIKEIGNITHSFVCIGNNSKNIEAAVKLRTKFEQMGIKSEIYAVVSGTDSAYDIKNCLSGAIYKKVAGKVPVPYNIKYIGDLQSLYSANAIINSSLEHEALESHKRYNNGNQDGFYEYEYNYKSSVASTLHLKAREFCGIKDSEVAELEHKRWNAYMRSEGYIYSGSTDAKTRNDLGKMHHNLVPFNELSKNDIKKDIRVGMKYN